MTEQHKEIEGTFSLSRRDVSEIVNAAVDHAILGLKYWVVIGILINGFPVLVVGGAFYYQLNQAVQKVDEHAKVLVQRRKFINDTSHDIQDLQEFLREEHGYVPRDKVNDQYN